MIQEKKRSAEDQEKGFKVLFNNQDDKTIIDKISSIFREYIAQYHYKIMDQLASVQSTYKQFTDSLDGKVRNSRNQMRVEFNEKIEKLEVKILNKLKDYDQRDARRSKGDWVFKSEVEVMPKWTEVDEGAKLPTKPFVAIIHNDFMSSINLVVHYQYDKYLILGSTHLETTKREHITHFMELPDLP